MAQKSNQSKKRQDSNVTPQAESANFRLLSLIDSKPTLFVIAALVILACIVFSDYVTFKNLFLFKDIGSDSLNGLYPPMRNIAHYFHNYGVPSWSFKYGMGQNMYPFMLRDPFTLILYLFGPDSVAYGLGFIECLKVILGGTIFYFYLRTMDYQKYACVAGGMLYSFTGFMILGSGWFMFSYEAVNLAFVLLSVEQLLRRKNGILFPLSIACIAISMPFNLYVYGVFVLLYCILRCSQSYNSVINKESLRFFGQLIVLGIVGLGLSSVFMFENVLQLLESPRGSGESTYYNLLTSVPAFATGDAGFYGTSIMRIFSSDMLGTGDQFIGWGNYLEAPLFYCGIITLVLFTQVFSHLDKKSKFLYAAFLSLWILPLIFPYFRYAFWLFTGDYYRAFSFFLALSLLILAIQALHLILTTGTVKVKTLLITAGALLILLYYPYFDALKNYPVNTGIQKWAMTLIVIYTALVYLLSKPKYKKTALTSILFVMAVESIYFSRTTINDRSTVSVKEFETKRSYNDYSVDAVNYLQKHDKSFYRIDKNYFSSGAKFASYNDGLVQDYYGTSCYNSFNQLYYVRFMQAIGIVDPKDETSSRWVTGLFTRPLVESVCNVKYFLQKGPPFPGLRISHDSLTTIGDVSIWQNRFPTPLGITFDKVMSRSLYDKVSRVQKDFSTLRCFFVDDSEMGQYKSDFKLINPSDTLPDSLFTEKTISEFINACKEDTLRITEFSETNIHGDISTDRKKMLFLAIPYDKSWQATVDGASAEIRIVDAGMSGILLNSGKHQITLEFKPRLRTAGLLTTLFFILIFGGMIYRQRKSKLNVYSEEAN